MSIAEPIVEKIKNNKESLKKYEQKIEMLDDKKRKDIIGNFPVVYVHSWDDKDMYEVYVGESNNIFQRTKEHYSNISDEKVWEHKLQDKDNAELYIIGHEHFNKSMTLDIENKLIKYLTCVKKIQKVNNRKSNPQNKYYPVEEVNIIFSKIWNKLKKDNNELFPSESQIKDSAIYKASPLHDLTDEQQRAKEMIIEKVIYALQNDEKGQLIFIEGEAGTGKTVLTSSTFYELIRKNEEEYNDEKNIYKDLKCALLVNHNEHITVYEQIVDKLGITDKYGKVVYKPTSFINNHSEELYDVIFVDEAHLLLTQGKQSYTGNNQLEDILKRARVVIVMFDEDQILNTENYWEDELIEKYRNKALESNNYIMLKDQLRIHTTNKEVINWLNLFIKQGILQRMPQDLGGYDIKIFDTPEELDKEITKKASNEKTRLSRLIATYSWKYNSNSKSKEGLSKYWEVKIGNWHKPWNRELSQHFSKKQKSDIKGLAWSEQPHTIREVGSIYTIQGFDLNYAGVIIGPSVKYRDGHVVFDSNESFNEKATRNRRLSNGTYKKFAEKFLRSELNVLMKRGVNGLYIYACDDELRKELKKCSQKSYEYEIKEENFEKEIAEEKI